jgi:uncharacterized protein YkwD
VIKIANHPPTHIIIVALVPVLSLALAACSSAPAGTAAPANEQPAGVAADTAVPAETAAPAEAAPTETAAEEPTTAPEGEAAAPTATGTEEPAPAEAAVTQTEPVSVSVQPPPYDTLALDILAKLNAWRISIGLWPLRPNDVLNTMAMDQAQYVLSLPELPSGEGYHIDALGRNPRGRALDYGWPYYNSPAQIAVTEIAAVGPTPDYAIDFWMNSQIHHDSVVNPAYREVGIAVLPHEFGNLYVVDLGARPDVLPALVDPDTGELYLSSEQYKWSSGGDWVHDVTEEQIVASADSPPNDNSWLSWQPTIPAPAASHYAVVYSDGEQETVTDVDPGVDIAWLPDNLNATVVAVAEAAVEVAQAGPTPAPSEEPTSGGEVGAPSATGEADVALIYDNQSLGVLNVSGGALNLTGLAFSGGETRLPITRWDTEWLDVPLSAFPAGDCLQIWSYDQNDPGKPAGCHYVRSSIYVAPDELFWHNGDFQVLWQGDPLLTCAVGAGRCEISLP